jgi:uncharacterized cupin superfamily protein
MSGDVRRPVVLVPGACLGVGSCETSRPSCARSGTTSTRSRSPAWASAFILRTTGVDLETHITDVVNLLDYENLEDAVLVGHSYAGIAITGMADWRPERFNAAVYLDTSHDEPPHTRVRRSRRGRLPRPASAAGAGRRAQRTGMSLWEVPPGQASYPYHWHIVDEELIVVLDDGLSLRGPDGEWRPLAEGEVVVFPVGGDGGHQLRNGGESPARFLSISNSPAEGHDIVFYPDSDKVGVFAQNVYELFPRDRAVGYWEGETPPA